MRDHDTESARPRERSGRRRRLAAALAGGHLAACATGGPAVAPAAAPAATVAAPAPRPSTLHGSWFMLHEESTPRPDARAARAMRQLFLVLSFQPNGTAQLETGQRVDGGYRTSGRTVTVVASGDTAAARVSLPGPGSRTAPLTYEMRGDTLWWEPGGEGAVPLRAWMPVLEGRRRLPAGVWRHPLPGGQRPAELQLTTGGCARFRASMGQTSRPYATKGDSLRTAFAGLFGISDHSRYTVRGDTLMLDFVARWADRPAEPIRLLFVRTRLAPLGLLDPAARCAPSAEP